MKLLRTLFDLAPYIAVAAVAALASFYGYSFHEFYEPLWLASFAVGAMWLVAVKGLVDAKLDDWVHHEYLGAALVALGSYYHVPWLALLGFVVMADDSYQHWRQWFGGDLAYRSPLHRLWEFAYSVVA